jgi:carbonic anhydrase
MDLIYRHDPHQPITHESFATAAAAQQALVNGNRRFVDIVRQMQRATMGETGNEHVVIPVSPLSLGLPLWPGGAPDQAPFALVLGCSDARVPVEQIFDMAFNDLFVIRIAGNVMGVECLGSVEYAVRQFAPSLKLVVVLGHSGCGAVTAAVDTYLSPKDYAEIAATHAVRSLVDRIQVAVRGAASALRHAGGGEVEHRTTYRQQLIETTVYLNAAVTAFDLRREVQSSLENPPQVVYGVYDLQSLQVRAMPAAQENRPRSADEVLREAPAHAEDFAELAARLAERVLAHGVREA